MDLTPREKDKIVIFTAGLLAERRLVRGVKLNHPQTIACIGAALFDDARDGRSGTTLFSREQVMQGIPQTIPGIQIETPFVNDSKRVTFHQPIA